MATRPSRVSHCPPVLYPARTVASASDRGQLQKGRGQGATAGDNATPSGLHWLRGRGKETLCALEAPAVRAGFGSHRGSGREHEFRLVLTWG